jgi:hypothetical protein
MHYSVSSVILFTLVIACVIGSYILRYKMSQRLNPEPKQEEKFSTIWWTTGKVRRLHSAYRRFHMDGKLATWDRRLTVLEFIFFFAWIYVTRR